MYINLQGLIEDFYFCKKYVSLKYSSLFKLLNDKLIESEIKFNLLKSQ